MDKLKPILTHKFWILAGVALLLPIVGWYMGTGKVAAEIDTRIAAINGLSVPAGNQIPNDDWMTKAKVVQDQRQERLDTAADYLWDAQQEYMTWPPNLRAYVADKKFLDELGVDAEQRYRGTYNLERENLLKIVDPFRWDDKAMKQVGKVAIDPTALATLPLDDSIWATSPPTSKEVWYIQEEMWLLRGLLEAVRVVNEQAGADSIVKTPIKEVRLIQLQGGDMAALAALATGEAGLEGESMDSSGGSSSGMAHGGGMSGGMMSGGMTDLAGQGAAAGGLDFDLAEEVGPNTLAVAAAEGDATGEEMASSGMAHSGGGGTSSGMAGLAAMYGGEGMASAPNPLLAEKRYVDDDAAAPFKTRAFKMQVVMDHRQIPEFLAELTNSPFPVRILRVHWVELNADPRFGGGTSYGGEGAMPGIGGRGMSSGGRGMGATGGRGMGSMGGGYSPPGMSSGGRGMGATGGRGVGSGMRSGLPGMTGVEGESGFGGETGQVDLYSQAMSNPYLAEVVVGGLMTIYRSPLEMAAAASAEGTDPAEAAPVEGEAAPVDGAAPLDGAAPAEGEVPADGTTPAEGEADPTDGTAPADAAPPVDGAAPAAETAPALEEAQPTDAPPTETPPAEEPAATQP